MLQAHPVTEAVLRKPCAQDGAMPCSATKRKADVRQVQAESLMGVGRASCRLHCQQQQSCRGTHTTSTHNQAPLVEC